MNLAGSYLIFYLDCTAISVISVALGVGAAVIAKYWGSTEFWEGFRGR